MNKKNILGQFYTPDCISKNMISKVIKSFPLPQKVVELAAGEGNLLNALCQQVKVSQITAVDIDNENVCLLKKSNPDWNVFHADAMKSLDFLSKGTFDIALGNPPFLGNVVVNEYLQELLNRIIGYDVKLGTKTRAEYVFICQYLELLRYDGILAIVVPDTLISGYRSAKFRERLIEKIEVIEVEEVTSFAFEYTEAKTHILYIKKSKPTKKILRLTADSQDGKSIEISISDARTRMDFSNYVRECSNSTKQYRLSDCAHISRGAKTHKELKILNCNYIHSTTFNSDFTEKIASTVLGEQHLAYGDIIMCRVGSRVVGKSREYKGIPTLYSDCIYRIRFNDIKLKKKFLKFLTSKEGVSTISSFTRGVCSRYITKADLESMSFN
ncbi:N-6 DNA methylase [Pseudoalteromonas sp. SG41-1]|uniref:N-6 DNA methylase n=1 Tax=Pseudoalteromonas sp. SG41-1 TaxID=2760979 RepID=UPI0015FFC2E7|nr:N-6 DNA methylase [Pseudoalteromonas sp. SG41-1]MBB1507067.1 N-6 DNA methylase [Pseudoalteromonas sp. SG41-1]